MVDNSGRIEAVDNLLLAIFAASLVIPTIAQSFGLETKLIWIPTICYSVWIVFTGYVKPRIAYSDSEERSMVERIRGWSYVIWLPVTLMSNSLIIFGSSSKTIYSYAIGFGAAVFVGLLLAILHFRVIRMFFWKEMKCMKTTQIITILKMVKETGSASIWASVCILNLSFTLLVPENLTLITAIIVLLVASLMLIYSYHKNRESSKIAKSLSRSLIDSKWSKNYNATVSKRDHKKPQRQKS